MRKLIITLLIGMFLISLASAWNTNTFNNSLTDENLTFSSNSITRYLHIPSGVNLLTTAKLNISYQQSTSEALVNWKLDEGTGTTSVDSNGNNKFTLVNGVTWVTGKYGNATQYDGVNQYAINSSFPNPIPFVNASNFSISVWFNATSFTNNLGTILSFNNDTNGFGIEKIGGEDTIAFWLSDDAGAYVNVKTMTLTTNTWYNVIATANSTSMSIYLNGVLNETKLHGNLLAPTGNLTIGRHSFLALQERHFTGVIDDIAIYNKSLTATEVTTLYESGTTTSNNNNFNVTAGGTFVQYLSVANQTPVTFDSVANVDLRSQINNYIATYGTGDIPITFNALNNAVINYNNLTFSNTGFAENSQTYNATSYEGAYETFKINVSYDTGYYYSASANLFYNGLSYSSTSQASDNDIIFTSSLYVPASASATSFPFYWNISLFNGTTTEYYISSTNNQAVSNQSIDDCTINTIKLFELNLRDEETQTHLDDTINSSIQVDLTLSSLAGTMLTNYSKKFVNDTNVTICIANNTATWRVDGTFEYVSDTREIEYYNVQRYLVNSSVQMKVIGLYDLLTTDATKFQITYKDENYLPVENALFDITRKYVGDGLFKTIEIPKTDVNGQSIAKLVIGDVVYTINVYKEGVLLKSFQNIRPVCANVLIGDCTINLNAFTAGTEPEDFEYSNGISYQMIFNESTKVITTTYTTQSGVPANVNVKAYDWGLTNTLLCDISLVSASGTLICNIPSSVKNATIKADLISDSKTISTSYFSIKPSAENIYGGVRVILSVLLFVSIAVMFASNLVFMLVGAMLGIIVLIVLNLMDVGGGGYYGMGTSFIWLLVVIILVSWRIMTRPR